MSVRFWHLPFCERVWFELTEIYRDGGSVAHGVTLRLPCSDRYIFIGL